MISSFLFVRRRWGQTTSRLRTSCSLSYRFRNLPYSPTSRLDSLVYASYTSFLCMIFLRLLARSPKRTATHLSTVRLQTPKLVRARREQKKECWDIGQDTRFRRVSRSSGSHHLGSQLFLLSLPTFFRLALPSSLYHFPPLEHPQTILSSLHRSVSSSSGPSSPRGPPFTVDFPKQKMIHSAGSLVQGSVNVDRSVCEKEGIKEITVKLRVEQVSFSSLE